MESVNIAVLGGAGAKEVAAAIGKKGGETDVTQYNAKKGTRSLTLFVPTKYPDKVQGVSYALQGAEYVLLVVDALDKQLGEQIVAADMVGARKGFLLLRNYIQPEQLKPILKGTALERWTVLESDDANDLRERFLDLPIEDRPGMTRVDVDQHFNVKGVGTVVLGVVRRGEVARHQKLRVHPTKLECQVRSIQVHDEDLQTAGPGSRVGLALKNIDSDDLDRGSVLAPDGTVTVIAKGETLEIDAKVSSFYKRGLQNDKVVHVGVGMQFLPARVQLDGDLKAGQSGRLRLVADTALCVTQGDHLVLFDLDASDLRVAAGGVVA